MEHCSPAHDTGNCHSTMDIIVLKTIVEGKYPLKLETRHGANHKKRGHSERSIFFDGRYVILCKTTQVYVISEGDISTQNKRGNLTSIRYLYISNSDRICALEKSRGI